MAVVAFGPVASGLERNRQAAAALDAARAAALMAREVGREAQDKCLADASKRADECVNLLGASQAEIVAVAQVERALIDLDSGQALAALDELLALAAKDRPVPGAPWTPNTAMIEAAIAETRYKIALMCRQEGDGFQSWSKYAEAAARSYQTLADQPAVGEGERAAYLMNLATCARLIHGGDEASHSLGFPARKTQDCSKKARIWERQRPNGGGGGGNDPKNPAQEETWTRPPEPNQDTKGR